MMNSLPEIDTTVEEEAEYILQKLKPFDGEIVEVTDWISTDKTEKTTHTISVDQGFEDAVRTTSCNDEEGKITINLSDLDRPFVDFSVWVNDNRFLGGKHQLALTFWKYGSSVLDRSPLREEFFSKRNSIEKKQKPGLSKDEILSNYREHRDLELKMVIRLLEDAIEHGIQIDDPYNDALRTIFRFTQDSVESYTIPSDCSDRVSEVKERISKYGYETHSVSEDTEIIVTGPGKDEESKLVTKVPVKVHHGESVILEHKETESMLEIMPSPYIINRVRYEYDPDRIEYHIDG